MRKPLRYFLLIFTLFLLLFKPLTVFTLEVYLTSLLETEVKVINLHLFSLDLQASIEDKNNLAHIKINSLYPLRADLVYEGDADAFKVYHPIKGQGVLTGNVYYKDTLKVEAELYALGALTKVIVTEQPENWEIKGKVLHLDLQKLQEENDFSLATSGEVDIDINITTGKDSLVKLTSDKVVVRSEVYTNLSLDIKQENDDIYAWAVFKAKNFENKGAQFHYDQSENKFNGKFDLLHKNTDNNLLIEVEGDYNRSIIMGQASLKLLNSALYAKNIHYNADTDEFKSSLEISLNQMQRHEYILKAFGLDLKGDLQAKGDVHFNDKALNINLNTQSLGGDLRLGYDGDKLEYKAKEIELAKLLYLLNSAQKLESKCDIEGSWSDSILQARLSTKSLKIEENEIKEIKMQAEGSIEDLSVGVQLQTPYARIESSTLRIKDLKHISIDANVTTPYTSDPIDVKAKVLHAQLSTSMELNASSPEFSLLIPQVDYADSKLDGSYTAELKPKFSKLKDTLVWEGKFSYADDFRLDLLNKQSGGSLNTRFINGKMSLQGQGWSLERVLNTLDQPSYAKGNFDLSIESVEDKLHFKIVSKRLSLNKKETGLDENLSCQIDGNLEGKELLVRAKVQNRYMDLNKSEIRYSLDRKKLKIVFPLIFKNDKESLALKLNGDMNLSRDINADIEISHASDRISLNKLMYKDERLQTELTLDVKKLERYKGMSKQELYGPLKFSGKAAYKNGVPDVWLRSSSLGGKLDIALKGQQLNIQLDKLSSIKIGRLLKTRATSEHGVLSGSVDYNLESKSGATRLTARDVQVHGIDIDKSLKEIRDMLGLNLYAMSKSLFAKRSSKNSDMKLSTQVEHIELDVDITPTLIISKDLALATTESRFAINTKLKHDGEIESFEIAILDSKGCAILTQKLQGNIKSPSLVDTKVASVMLSSVGRNVSATGGKILDAGASVIDSAASFVWKKGFRQDSNVSLVQDGLDKSTNMFSSGKDLVVRGKCKIFYTGAVKDPD